jgi:hypothetical protein
METSGISNAVQISTSTYNAMLNKEKYHFQLRRDVMVKGVGKKDTYIVSR